MKSLERIEQAKYREAILPEHKGNPLIEALYPKTSNNEVMESFCNYPELSPEVRDIKDPLIREEYLLRIEHLRQPLPVYLDCFRAIERAIKSGYSAKNPLSPTTAFYLHYLVDDHPEVLPKTGKFIPKGKGITILGDSGVGKTSMLEQVLGYFPQVIEHDEYNGQSLGFKHQVVWIKVDCPSKSSIRELCEFILFALDEAMNKERSTPARNIPGLLDQIERRIKSSFLGLLVIDEMQNLEFKRTQGEANLLKFLHHIVNKLGVPLVFCANPPFDESLVLKLKNARRAESGGVFYVHPLERNSIGWKTLVEELWDLQWTDIETPLTEELSDKLYELSLGNIDMACRTYCESQRLVIGSGDERISTAVLEQGYSIACTLSSKTVEVINAREEFNLPRRRRKQQTKASEVKTGAQRKPRIIGDVNRPHHPEFEVRLRELHLADDLLERIGDPEKVRRADRSIVIGQDGTVAF